MSSIVTQAWEIEGEAEDFAKEIHDAIDRFLPGIQIGGKDIMWVAFQHPGKTKTGIIVPASFQKESGIQGIVGLIVKIGPLASTDPEIIARWNGTDLLGKWAVIDTRFGIKHILGGGRGVEGRHIRILESGMIYELVERPDWIV